MSCTLYQVDTFTDKPFSGNPAAVCLLDTPRSDVWMQALGAEMNLSETAIVERRRESNTFNLRWFTPVVEVDLCGHATLAAAHMLWQEGEVPANEEIHFHARGGLLKARNNEHSISLDFPKDPVREVIKPTGLAAALGVEAQYIGRGRHDLLVVVESEEVVCQLMPDFQQLATIPARGIAVTAISSSDQFDFVSRFFAPNVGINEDPVTGSAHCMLADYWQSRLNKKSFMVRQLSPRGGELQVDIGGVCITLGGQVITVFRGELYD